jgi:hypothetical protein
MKKRPSSPASTTNTDPHRRIPAAPFLTIPVGSVVVNATEVGDTPEPGAVAVAPDVGEVISDPPKVVGV